MPSVLGFDSSVLSPFARAKRLGMLEQLTDGYTRVTTPAVLDELENGRAAYPQLGDVQAASWLTTVSTDSLEMLVTFSQYVRVLGAGSRDIGEASILAWAEVKSGIAILDDNAGVTIAKSRGVIVRRSLWLVADGLNRSKLDIDEARALVDELITAGGARYPCDGHDFQAWAERNGLVTPLAPR